MPYDTNFYVKKLDNFKIARIIFFNNLGDNFWYDIPTPFDEDDYFWNKNSEGYARLYFIDYAPMYGDYAPQWVKEDCGWES